MQKGSNRTCCAGSAKGNSSKAAPVEQKAEEPVMAKVEPKKVETVPVKEVTEAKSSQFEIYF